MGEMMNEQLVGKDLDAVVAERVMGWVRERQESPSCEPDGQEWRKPDGWRAGCVCHHTPRYSTDIDEAWRVVDHLRREKGAHWEIACGTTGWGAVVCWEGEGGLASAAALTAPLAICRAALKAVSG